MIIKHSKSSESRSTVMLISCSAAVVSSAILCVRILCRLRADDADDGSSGASFCTRWFEYFSFRRASGNVRRRSWYTDDGPLGQFPSTTAVLSVLLQLHDGPFKFRAVGGDRSSTGEAVSLRNEFIDVNRMNHTAGEEVSPVFSPVEVRGTAPDGTVPNSAFVSVLKLLLSTFGADAFADKNVFRATASTAPICSSTSSETSSSSSPENDEYDSAHQELHNQSMTNSVDSNTSLCHSSTDNRNNPNNIHLSSSSSMSTVENDPEDPLYQGVHQHTAHGRQTSLSRYSNGMGDGVHPGGNDDGSVRKTVKGNSVMRTFTKRWTRLLRRWRKVAGSLGKEYVIRPLRRVTIRVKGYVSAIVPWTTMADVDDVETETTSKKMTDPTVIQETMQRILEPLLFYKNGRASCGGNKHGNDTKHNGFDKDVYNVLPLQPTVAVLRLPLGYNTNSTNITAYVQALWSSITEDSAVSVEGLVDVFVVQELKTSVVKEAEEEKDKSRKQSTEERVTNEKGNSSNISRKSCCTPPPEEDTDANCNMENSIKGHRKLRITFEVYPAYEFYSTVYGAYILQLKDMIHLSMSQKLFQSYFNAVPSGAHNNNNENTQNSRSEGNFPSPRHNNASSGGYDQKMCLSPVRCVESGTQPSTAAFPTLRPAEVLCVTPLLTHYSSSSNSISRGNTNAAMSHNSTTVSPKRTKNNEGLLHKTDSVNRDGNEEGALGSSRSRVVLQVHIPEDNDDDLELGGDSGVYGSPNIFGSPLSPSRFGRGSPKGTGHFRRGSKDVDRTLFTEKRFYIHVLRQNGYNQNDILYGKAGAQTDSPLFPTNDSFGRLCNAVLCEEPEVLDRNVFTMHRQGKFSENVLRAMEEYVDNLSSALEEEITRELQRLIHAMDCDTPLQETKENLRHALSSKSLSERETSLPLGHSNVSSPVMRHAFSQSGALSTTVLHSPVPWTGSTNTGSEHNRLLTSVPLPRYLLHAVVRREAMRETLLRSLKDCSQRILTIPLPDQRIYRTLPPSVPRCVCAFAWGFPVLSFTQELINHQHDLRKVHFFVEKQRSFAAARRMERQNGRRRRRRMKTKSSFTGRVMRTISTGLRRHGSGKCGPPEDIPVAARATSNSNPITQNGSYSPSPKEAQLLMGSSLGSRPEVTPTSPPAGTIISSPATRPPYTTSTTKDGVVTVISNTSTIQNGSLIPESGGNTSHPNRSVEPINYSYSSDSVNSLCHTSPYPIHNTDDTPALWAEVYVTAGGDVEGQSTAEVLSTDGNCSYLTIHTPGTCSPQPQQHHNGNGSAMLLGEAGKKQLSICNKPVWNANEVDRQASRLRHTLQGEPIDCGIAYYYTYADASSNLFNAGIPHMEETDRWDSLFYNPQLEEQISTEQNSNLSPSTDLRTTHTLSSPAVSDYKARQSSVSSSSGQDTSGNAVVREGSLRRTRRSDSGSSHGGMLPSTRVADDLQEGGDGRVMRVGSTINVTPSLPVESEEDRCARVLAASRQKRNSLFYNLFRHIHYCYFTSTTRFMTQQSNMFDFSSETNESENVISFGGDTTRRRADLNYQKGQYGLSPLEVFLCCRYSRKIASETYIMDVAACKGDAYIPFRKVVDEVAEHAVLYYHNYNLKDFVQELEKFFGLEYTPRTRWAKLLLQADAVEDDGGTDAHSSPHPPSNTTHSPSNCVSPNLNDATSAVSPCLSATQVFSFSALPDAAIPHRDKEDCSSSSGCGETLAAATTLGVELCAQQHREDEALFSASLPLKDEDVTSDDRQLLRELEHVKDFLILHRNTLLSATLSASGSNRLEAVFGVPATVFPFLMCDHRAVPLVHTLCTTLFAQYGKKLTFENFSTYVRDVYAHDRPEVVRHTARVFRTLNRSRCGFISYEEICGWLARKLSCGDNVRPDMHLHATLMSLRLPMLLLTDKKFHWSQLKCTLSALSDGDREY